MIIIVFYNVVRNNVFNIGNIVHRKTILFIIIVLINQFLLYLTVDINKVNLKFVASCEYLGNNSYYNIVERLYSIAFRLLTLLIL